MTSIKEVIERIARLEKRATKLGSLAGVQVYPDQVHIGQNTRIEGDLVVTGSISQAEVSEWHTLADSATYSSAYVLVLDGTYTDSTQLKKGTKVRLLNGSVKYFYVLSAELSAGSITVTFVTNTSYSLAAGTISGLKFSSADPKDFPNWMDWTPTRSNAVISGIDSAQFAISDGVLHVIITAANKTISGTGTMDLTLPLALTSSGLFTFNIACYDNTTAAWRYVRSDTGAGTNALYIMNTMGFSTWANGTTGVYLQVRGSTRL